MRADYHIHTNYSIDSKVHIEEYIKKAIDEGINELCFTDHVDYGISNEYTDWQVVEYNEFFKEFNKLKEKYKGKIILKSGMEFGVQLHTINEFNRDFSLYPFDFIILSTHEIDDKEFWLYEYQEGKSQMDYNIEYYKNLSKLVDEFDNFSVIGHLDLIKRYDKEGILDDSLVIEYVEEILKKLIKNNKGIEVNTSSIRYKINDLMPSRNILKLYKSLGGEIITIGSDSHSIEHLAEGFDEIITELKEIGFNKLCTFDKMKPKFYDI